METSKTKAKYAENFRRRKAAELIDMEKTSITNEMKALNARLMLEPLFARIRTEEERKWISCPEKD